MASPMRPSTRMSMPGSPAAAHSQRQATRAPSRSAFCSGSRLRPSRASTAPIARNSATISSKDASGSATRSMNCSTE